MRERYSRDLGVLLEIQLAENERVRAVVTAYEELAEEEKILFRLATGISQNAAGGARELGRRSISEGSDGIPSGRIQPIVRQLMKTLLEDHPTLLTETDLANLMTRDYTQRTMGLQLGGFPLLRRRESGRNGSDNDERHRFYAKLYGGRFYVCSQWWKDDHFSNARSLLRSVDQLGGRDPNHAGIPELERHSKALGDYIGRSA